MQLTEEEIKKRSEAPDLSNAEISPMTPSEGIEELSDIAVRILCGAEVYEAQHFNPQMIRVTLGGTTQVIHRDDMLLAKWAADKAYNEFIRPGHLELMVRSLPYMLEARKWIRKNLENHYSKKDSKLNVLFLRGDNTGCGFWRIKLPGDILRDEDNDLNIYVSDLEIEYSKLVNYDMIVVQRVFSFDQYYVLESLKRAGKKIVYEIDDDVFNIEPHNPAAVIFNRFDAQLCIKSCLNLADAVIVTTERLAKALQVEDKAIIYPNSLDWDTLFSAKSKNPARTKTRLFWAGSNTHDEDFQVCIEALKTIFAENENVELFIMGSLPRSLYKMQKDYSDRILVCPGMHTEAYFNYLQFHLDADIGLIPLINSIFNHSKSTCKGLEYTLARVPIVTSNHPPYSDVYENNKDAILCSSEEEWYQAIIKLMENKEMREELIKNARMKAAEKFNLRTNSSILGNALSNIGCDIISSRNQQKTDHLDNLEVAQNL